MPRDSFKDFSRLVRELCTSSLMGGGDVALLLPHGLLYFFIGCSSFSGVMARGSGAVALPSIGKGWHQSSCHKECQQEGCVVTANNYQLFVTLSPHNKYPACNMDPLPPLSQPLSYSHTLSLSLKAWLSPASNLAN